VAAVAATFKVSVRKCVEGKDKVEANARGLRMIMDEPKEADGDNEGMNPVEALLSALGGCQVIGAVGIAREMGFAYEECHIEIEGDFDPDVRPGMKEIRYALHFMTDEPQERVDELAERVAKLCPVALTLENGVKLVRNTAVKD
jgi:uncharacterized OsmC-like protein